MTLSTEVLVALITTIGGLLGVGTQNFFHHRRNSSTLNRLSYSVNNDHDTPMRDDLDVMKSAIIGVKDMVNDLHGEVSRFEKHTNSTVRKVARDTQSETRHAKRHARDASQRAQRVEDQLRESD